MKWREKGGMKILIHEYDGIPRDFILSRYSDRSFGPRAARIYRHRGHREHKSESPLIKTGLTYFLRSSKVELQIRLLYPPSPFLLIVTYCLSFPPFFFKGKVHFPFNFSLLVRCTIKG